MSTDSANGYHDGALDLEERLEVDAHDLRDSLTHEPGGLTAGDLETGQAEEAAEQGPPVDPPDRRSAAADRIRAKADARRRPLVPEWMATQVGRRTVTRIAASAAGHWTLYRLVHLLPDLGLLAWYAVVGAGRLAWGSVQFVGDGEARPLRKSAILSDDHKAYIMLVRERNARISRRMAGAVTLGVLTLPAVGLFVWLAPIWLTAPAMAGAVVGLVRAGRPVGRPILSPATVRSTVPRLTSVAIVRALAGVGIGPLTTGAAKGETAEWFPEPITRTAVGHEVGIELPHGTTAAEVADKREKLAAGLRRPIGCVWPMGEPRVHPGRLTLHVLDAPMSKMVQPAWPLAKTGRCDVFKPILLGWDQRGRPVTVLLMFSNLLVGSIPRQGKSRTVRVLMLAASFDVTCELHDHELKGTDDDSMLEPYLHRYTTGAGSTDTPAIESVMASIREVHGYLDPRAKTIARVSRENPARCPDKKVTRELADDASLKLHPVILKIDEVHELFETEFAAEAEQKLTAIIKRGPALGIMLILATQRPDAKSIPTAISANVGLRFCLRVGGWKPNNLILGDGAYAMGMRADLFTEDDKGCGLLRDGGTTAQTVRGADIDGPAAEPIARRALAMRTAAGVLSGDAVGEHIELERNQLEVVYDCIRVFRECPSSDESVWLHQLEELLTEWAPSEYGDLEVPWLGDRLRAIGVPTMGQRKRNVDGEQVNRAGVSLAVLRKAVEGREQDSR
jgi:S-DNA-T family DNA segregation ATPase FtsK/SpoIIIE